MRKDILIVLWISLLVRTAMLFMPHPIWWDDAVYAGMGKFISSSGTEGFWEHIRPPVVPLLLSPLSLAGLDEIIYGRVMMLVLSVCSVWLMYSIGTRLFGRETGLVAGLLLSFSPTFLQSGFRVNTEVPMVFLILFGMYLMLEKKYLFSGLILGLAALTKFPAGIFIIIFGGVYLLQHKRIPWAFGTGVGFPLMVYLIVNQVAYGNAFAPIFDAQVVITQVLGCNAFHAMDWTGYFVGLFWEHPFHSLLAFGLPAILMRRYGWVVVLCALVPLLYLLTMPCKEVRYLLLVLPFLSLINSYGISQLFRGKKFFMVFALFTIVFGIYTSWLSEGTYAEEYPISIEASHSFISNPWPVLESSGKHTLLYYPVFTAKKGEEILEILRHEYDPVLWDDCSGGIACLADDANCHSSIDSITAYLSAHYSVAATAEYYGCRQTLYSISSS